MLRMKNTTSIGTAGFLGAVDYTGTCKCHFHARVLTADKRWWFCIDSRINRTKSDGHSSGDMNSTQGF